MSRLVTAAGGVVFRTTSKGNLKVLLAHRPGYDDWSFPKGKADDDETPEETAIREVLEETGYNCRIVAPLTTTRHRLSNGSKEVSWFAMRPLPDSPGFKKNSEVDEIQWLTRRKARQTLDYDNDVELLDDADLTALAKTGTIWILRHAEAGDRSSWDGDDRLRPLTKEGRKQANAIATALATAGIDRVVTSPYERCRQTAAPLAATIRAKLEQSDGLAEGASPESAFDLIRSLAGHNAVLCTHGDVLPQMMKRMTDAGLEAPGELDFAKGAAWEISVESGRFISCRYLPQPEV